MALDCWEDLGLPKAGREWSNEEVLAFFDEQEKRAIAFAMASHARLGQESDSGTPCGVPV